MSSSFLWLELTGKGLVIDAKSILNDNKICSTAIDFLCWILDHVGIFVRNMRYYHKKNLINLENILCKFYFVA